MVINTPPNTLYGDKRLLTHSIVINPHNTLYGDKHVCKKLYGDKTPPNTLYGDKHASKHFVWW